MDTYKATNRLNGKFYIGSTKNFEKRKKGHLKSRENYPFQNALRNNPEAFEWEVWSDDSDEPVLEQALLDMWFGKEQCYNLNPYASRPSLETSVKNGRKAFENKTGIFDEEWRSSEDFRVHQRKAGAAGGRKIVELGLGIHDSDYKASEQYIETRRKTGARMAEEGVGMFTPEVKERAREARMTALCQPVTLISPSGEEMSFPSLREANRVTEITRSQIKSMLESKDCKYSRLGWKAYLGEVKGKEG